MLFSPDVYSGVLWGMTVLALTVWAALTRIEAPYGITYRSGWGPDIGNRAGWVMMEAPAFFAMAAMMLFSPAGIESAGAAYVCATLYMIHYFRRSFLFPMLMRGRSRMPLVIALSGALFNIINVYMLGGWLFFVAPQQYPLSWLGTWQFAVGTLIFLFGMGANWQADRIVRHLRKPGDTAHHIPRGGLFRYVTAASYLGEIVEWAGFALLTWSWAGAVFLLWTAANLVPRAARLHARYMNEFGDEYRRLNRRRIIPFLY